MRVCGVDINQQHPQILQRKRKHFGSVSFLQPGGYAPPVTEHVPL